MNDQALALALKNADFTTAEHCAQEYGRSVCCALEGALDQNDRTAIYHQAIETLQGHLHLARVLRAHLAAEVQGNSCSCLYTTVEVSPHCWQVEG